MNKQILLLCEFAMFFSLDLNTPPPNIGDALRVFRIKMQGVSELPQLAGEYDLVVVGGGVAGCCLAIYPDGCITATWPVDLHYPRPSASGCEPFCSEAKTHQTKPYPIPYRCLYSRNVDNLMMAGRNISVTHVALGTVRVMRTTGMMGEALGVAAGLCVKHNCDPRDVYKKHLDELKALLRAS